jgi:transcriptional regulator with XRE-family HTH domain
VTSSVHQAREALGHRLRDIRKDAGLTGRQLALLAGWPNSKVSKIEYGRQTPTEDDIRLWCRHSRADERLADLIATVRHIEAMYVEWRRMLGTGTRRRQVASIKLEAQTYLFRWYEPALRTTVGGPEVMAGQLDRLLTIVSLPRVSLGIIPTRANYQVPTNQLIMFDDRLAHVESISAELTISQPREISLYAKAFQELSRLAVYGQSAKALIRSALTET